MSGKLPNENCEMCEGSGVIDCPDEINNYVHFSGITCDCVKYEALTDEERREL